MSPWERDLARFRRRDEVWRANISAAVAGVVLLLVAVLVPVLPAWGMLLMAPAGALACVVMLWALEDRARARRALRELDDE